MSRVNWAQLASLSRSLVPFIGGLLVMRGIMNATQFDALVNQIGTVVTDMTVLVGMLAPIGTAVWGMAQHTDAATVKAAAAVPGATVKIAVKEAAPEIVSIATDPTVPKVQLETETPK